MTKPTFHRIEPEALTAPLSRAQSMIWIGEQRDPGTPVFNTAWWFELPDAPDPERFQQALLTVVDSCDALRLIVTHDTSGHPVQTDTGCMAGRHEFCVLPSEAAAVDWMAHAVRRPFEPGRETFHSALIQLPGNKAIWYFNQHHVVTDAWSSSLIFAALDKAYSGAVPDALPSFLDHAAAEPGHVDETNAAFWNATTLSEAPVPRLYGQASRPGETASAMPTIDLGEERSFRLNTLLSQKGFGALSRAQAHFNLFATVVAVWMARVTGEDRVPLGVVSHGRQTPTARRTAGCFIELFPMVLDLPSKASFRGAHRHVTERGFDLLRRATPGTSTTHGLSRFNAVVNVVPARFGKWQGQPVTAHWLDTGAIDPHHAFRMNVLDPADGDSLSLALAFNKGVFDEGRRDAATRHILAILDAFLDDPDQLIEDVPLFDDGDASAALVRQDPFLDPEPIKDVLAAFEDSVAAGETEVSVVCGDVSLSRRALMRRMDALALALRHQGIEPGDRVGLYLTRSVDLVAACLAVLKIGATFVPLDPGQTARRLSVIRDLAGLRVILTEADLVRADSGLLEGKTPVIDVSTVSDAGTGPVPASNSDHPAYVIFTSGSTGVPKGVVVGRAALSRYAAWANTTFAGGQPSRWALHSAIGFDLTITSIFAPLVSGGTVVAYREAPGSPNLSVLDVMQDNSVDVVKLTPAHLRLALETPVRPGQVRALVLGGEALPVDLCQLARDALGDGISIFNEYGPTEATVGCMVHRFDPNSDTGATVPIGRPASDTAVYVLDRGLSPVADNVPGDVYVAGPDRLADGYLNRPEETAAAFVENPFASGRMYRTGDIASVRRDGTLLYHGRADSQIKVGGVRIEPAEIENAVRAIPGVEQCALLVFDREKASKQLCRSCGAPRALPNVQFAADDLCRTCAEFDEYSARVADYFGDLDELRSIIGDRSKSRTGPYDCVMLLSGGKDSTYALSRLSEITPNILAATLDNGFISDEAKRNITVITERLGIDHRFLRTPAMNEIFVDSLKRHANVCNGCFKTIYTLALHLAKEVGAPTVVTGLSRGQLFETRLAPELFEGKAASRREIDEMVMAARRSYHTFPDVAAQKLNGTLFDGGDPFSAVDFVDFYRYCDVPVAEVYRHLKDSVGWSRPMDTGRSTNCLINDVGIHVHKIRRGHHNYALPYSWDVRLGHKTRDEAVDELQDEINMDRVQSILKEIGFDQPVETESRAGPQLALYYVAQAGVTAQDIRRELLGNLPREMVPSHIRQIDRIPLTPNGKIDANALPTPDVANPEAATAEAIPDDTGLSPTERRMIDIWRRVLGRQDVSAQSNFYDVGGESLAAIQIASQCAAAGLAVSAQDIFRRQTVSAISAHLKEKASAHPDGAATGQPVPSPASVALSDRNKARLQALFGKKSNG